VFDLVGGSNNPEMRLLTKTTKKETAYASNLLITYYITEVLTLYMVLGAYYARARMYDADDRRFMAIDQAKDGLNWYAYCGNNPILYYDPNGEAPKRATPETRQAQKDGWLSFWLSATEDKLDLKGNIVKNPNDFLPKQMVGTGVYSISQDYWQSTELVGYNKLYNMVANVVTDIDDISFEFKFGNVRIKIWAWKGDYVNLGAGAELGIYWLPDYNERLECKDVAGGFRVNRDNEPSEYTHWYTGQKDYRMPMEIALYHKGGLVFNRKPYEWKSEKTWWITGFKPELQKVKSSDLTAHFTIDFSEKKDLYNAFVKSSDYFREKHLWSGNENGFKLKY
jgi:hypothetical protein